MTPDWSTLVTVGRNALAFVGGAAGAYATYVQLGGPIPAMRGYVDDKIEAVGARLDVIHATVLEGHRRSNSMNRAFLRNEKAALTKGLDAASEGTRSTLQRRVAEIDDQLADLVAEDEEKRKQILHLRGDRGKSAH